MTQEPTRFVPPASGAGPGLLLKGRYRIQKELGRGGIGVVYLAHDEQLHSRPVVIKVLLEQTEGSEWFQKKFRGELEALVRIDHPGVVGALDAGEMPDGKPFIVMQFVKGVTLRSLMAAGPMELGQAALILRQVGGALTAAHDKGVHHRDLKPENIMVQDLGHGELQVKIIDFGIASVLDPSEAGTQMTQVAGSVLYMAPEQLMGRPQAGSDIYALAVIAYEMLTGRPPYRPHSPYELLGIQREGVKERPSELRPGLTPEVDAVILKGLALEPRDRQASARELADELVRTLASQLPTLRGPQKATEVMEAPTAPQLSPPTQVPPRTQVTPPPPAVPAPAPRPSAAAPAVRSRTPLLIAGGVVALVVAGLAVALLWPTAPEEAGSGSVDPTVAPAQTARELAYHITVQRYQDGSYRDPFRLTREMVFGPKDRVRVTVSSPQTGFLYVVNEGPDPASGQTTFNVLHPKTTVEGGSAALSGGKEIHIPSSEGYFRFDEAQGTEHLWLVFAEREVPELEAVKGLANPVDRGAVKDPAQAEALRAFLARHRSDPPRSTADEAGRRTVLRAPGSALVSLLKLEHM